MNWIIPRELFEVYRFCIRLFVVYSAKITRDGTKLVWICIEENLPRVLPLATVIAMLGWIMLFASLYGGFFIKYPEK